MYRTQVDLDKLWAMTLGTIQNLDRSDRIAFFNAKRFLCFQLAKLLDGVVMPMRKSYQSVIVRQTTQSLKGPYPIFDNVTALFCSNPVITRTATYLYACTEWIDDAFQGKELLLEIYSRLMNPTSVSLANHIVDIEVGKLAGEYFALNFNSGMAAIDCILSHLIGYRDIIISSRNIYGGSYQLIHDWFAKSSNLDIGLEWVDGTAAGDFKKMLDKTRKKYSGRLKKGKHIYIFFGISLQSPWVCSGCARYLQNGS